MSIAAGQASGLLAEDAKQPHFPVPEALAPAVAFWTRVYTEVDSASGFVHDDRHLDVVYGTLYLNPHAPPGAQNRRIETALGEYRKALLYLASGKRGGLTAIEKRALSAWGEQTSASELKSAAQRLRFQRGQSDRTLKGLSRYNRWKAKIEAVLEKRGLPAELAALPLVESSYNPRAESKAGAIGLWQFMPATARRYLRVDDQVDERLDPMKSTEAAALLLQQNHSVLKSWPLAITAYNHGLSGVRRAVRVTGTDDLGEIAGSYATERFGFASRNFYAAFLAAVEVSSHPTRYFRQQLEDARAQIALVSPAYLPVEALVAAFELDKDRLRSLNPALHHAVWNGAQFVPEGHMLNLPGTLDAAWAEERLAKLAEHFGFSAQKPSPYYEVRLGDSLSQIAARHDTSTATLLAMNRLSSADEIHAGQVLRVPLMSAPKPLGPGGATLLAAQRAIGEIDVDAVSLGRLIAMLDGADGAIASDASEDAAQVRNGSDACGTGAAEGSPAEPTEHDNEDIETTALLAEVQPDLAADPADYGVAADGTIEIQIDETLGHYADWLKVSSDRIRRLNGLKSKAALIVGRRLKLEFSVTGAGLFEERRIAHHQARQLGYFRRHRIRGVIEHPVVAGDNLWLLAVQQYGIPLWLLRQYNPDVNVDTILSLGSLLYVPFVETMPEDPPCSVAHVSTSTPRGDSTVSFERSESAERRRQMDFERRRKHP